LPHGTQSDVVIHTSARSLLTSLLPVFVAMLHRDNVSAALFRARLYTGIAAHTRARDEFLAARRSLRAPVARLRPPRASTRRVGGPTRLEMPDWLAGWLAAMAHWCGRTVGFVRMPSARCPHTEQCTVRSLGAVPCRASLRRATTLFLSL